MEDDPIEPDVVPDVTPDTPLEDEETHEEDEGKPKLLNYFIPYESINVDFMIGKGQFGAVYHGLYKSREVAIKRIPQDYDRSAVPNSQTGPEWWQDVYFRREVEILASVKHPNVVRFEGVCFREQFLYLLTEFIPGGDLRKHLVNKNPDWIQRVVYAIQIARAISYLHTCGIVHRDIKTENVLIVDDYTVKLCDFGFAREVTARKTKKNYTFCGSEFFEAPEIMFCLDYDERVDIFSYGLVLCEIISRQSPSISVFPRVIPGFGIASQEIQDRAEPGCPEAMIRWAIQCCSDEPDGRPELYEVDDDLSEVIITLEDQATATSASPSTNSLTIAIPPRVSVDDQIPSGTEPDRSRTLISLLPDVAADTELRERMIADVVAPLSPALVRSSASETMEPLRVSTSNPPEESRMRSVSFNQLSPLGEEQRKKLKRVSIALYYVTRAQLELQLFQFDWSVEVVLNHYVAFIRKELEEQTPVKFPVSYPIDHEFDQPKQKRQSFHQTIKGSLKNASTALTSLLVPGTAPVTYHTPASASTSSASVAGPGSTAPPATLSLAPSSSSISVSTLAEEERLRNNDVPDRAYSRLLCLGRLQLINAYVEEPTQVANAQLSREEDLVWKEFLVETFRLVPLGDRQIWSKNRLKTYRSCFSGAELVETFLKSSNNDIKDRLIATNLGHILLLLTLIVPVSSGKQFHDDPNILYRFRHASSAKLVEPIHHDSSSTIRLLRRSLTISHAPKSPSRPAPHPNSSPIGLSRTTPEPPSPGSSLLSPTSATSEAPPTLTVPTDKPRKSKSISGGERKQKRHFWE